MSYPRMVMGGCFIGRPMDPESRPAKTKKASAESRYKSHGLGWKQADQGPCGERDSYTESYSELGPSKPELRVVLGLLLLRVPFSTRALVGLFPAQPM